MNKEQNVEGLNVSPAIAKPMLPAVCPKLSAIAHIWDNEERHMVSCMDDYFKNINREKTPEQKLAWDNYLKKSKELEKRRKKGMLLFAKYYQQLWD